MYMNHFYLSDYKLTFPTLRKMVKKYFKSNEGKMKSKKSLKSFGKRVKLRSKLNKAETDSSFII